jgi:hypothetical protein
MSNSQYTFTGAIPVGIFGYHGDALSFIERAKYGKEKIDLTSIPMDSILVSRKFVKKTISSAVFQRLELISVQENGHLVLKLDKQWLAIMICEIAVTLTYTECLFDDDEI